MAGKPIAIAMLVGSLVVLGVLALVSIPVTVSRAAAYPGVTIEVSYSGVSPEKIEEIITRPIEEAVSTVGAIEEISSESEEGKSRVHVQFDPSVNADFKSLEIRERLDLVSAAFPREAHKPILLKYDPDQRPVMILLLRSNKRSMQELRELADREIKKVLEGVPGTSQVFVAGGRDREILVDCDRQKLESFGLSMRDLLGLLQAANFSAGVGLLQDGSMRIPVQVRGRFRTIDDVRKTRLHSSEQGTVYLEDVASIRYAFKEESSAARHNGAESVTLYVYKGSTADLLSVSAAVHQVIEHYPRTDISFETLQDSASIFRRTLRNISLMLLSGFVSVFLLGPPVSRGKAITLFCGFSLLLAFLSSILVLYLLRWPVDLLALASVVTCAWVLLTMATWGGRPPVEAALPQWTSAALLYCGLVLCVVLPIVMAGSDFRRIYGALAILIAVSLPVGLIGVRASFRFHLSAAVRQAELKYASMRRSILAGTENRFSPRIRSLVKSSAAFIRKWYRKGLRASVRRPRIVWGIVLLLLVTGFWAVRDTQKILSAGLDAAEIQARVEMPSGTSFEETDRITKEVEKRLGTLKEIGSITARVEPAQATLTLKLSGASSLDEELLARLRALTSGLSPAFVHFSAESAGGLLEDLGVDVIGEDLETLDRIVKELASRSRSVPGSGESLLRYKPPRPEVLLVIDKIKAEQSGISAQDIGESVRYAIEGGVATKFVSDEREMDIRIRYKEGTHTSRADLEELAVRRKDGKFVPLKTIARQIDSSIPVKIYRKNKKRTFGFSLQPTSISAETLASRMGFLNELRLPEGYRIEFGRELKDARARQAKLGGIALVIVILVLMTIAARDESFRSPVRSLAWLPVVLSVPALLIRFSGTPLTVPLIVSWCLAAAIVVLRVRQYQAGGSAAHALRHDAWLAAAFFLPVLFLPSEGRSILRALAFGTVLTLGWSAAALPVLWRQQLAGVRLKPREIAAVRVKLTRTFRQWRMP